ncbi:MAG TPA: RDD family protein [Solirubrobacterales bacterium]|nr:RDD family protein [Solirubrobacterales bacterium]
MAGRIVSAGVRTSLRATERVAESSGLDRELEDAVERAMVNVLESDLTDRLWERLLDSDETQKLIERIAEAPEVRRAIRAQSVGMIEDVGGQVAELTEAVDSRLERIARRVVGRPARAGPTENGGLVSRAIAFILDATIFNVSYFLVSAVIAIAFAAISPGSEDATDVSTPALVLGTVAWLAWISAYLVFFWSVSGQTPGMRFMGLRLDADGVRRLGLRRALRRLAGTVVAALPLGLGFLAMLVDDRRRAWNDRIAETEVVFVGRGEEAAVPRVGAARTSE